MSMFECIFVVVSCTFCNFKHIPVSDSFHKHLYAILGVYFVAFSNVSHPIGAESRFSKLRENLDHKCMAVFCPECLRRGVEADSCWTGKTCLNRLHYLITPCSFSQYRPCATHPPRACKVGFAVYTVITEASAVHDRVSGWMEGLAGLQDIIHLLKPIYFLFSLEDVAPLVLTLWRSSQWKGKGATYSCPNHYENL